VVDVLQQNFPVGNDNVTIETWPYARQATGAVYVTIG